MSFKEKNNIDDLQFDDDANYPDYKEHFEEQNPREMTECVAITMDDKGTSLRTDDCMETYDGYICKVCK
jgi:hypothetical protein